MRQSTVQFYVGDTFILIFQFLFALCIKWQLVTCAKNCVEWPKGLSSGCKYFPHYKRTFNETSPFSNVRSVFFGLLTRASKKTEGNLRQRALGARPTEKIARMWLLTWVRLWAWAKWPQLKPSQVNACKYSKCAQEARWGIRELTSYSERQEIFMVSWERLVSMRSANTETWPYKCLNSIQSSIT